MIKFTLYEYLVLVMMGLSFYEPKLIYVVTAMAIVWCLSAWLNLNEFNKLGE